MGLQDVEFDRAYDTGMPGVDVLLDFYVPALAQSTRYDRLAGFFSSASLAVAAKGIAGLIASRGKMRVVACPRFPQADLEMLSNIHDAGERVSLAERAAFAALDTDGLTDEIARNHVRAMAWMLAEGHLDIRLAVPTDMEIARDGLFHQKVGVLTDAVGDSMSFSGSINETASAWLDNVEQFKVFRSWETWDHEMVEFDTRAFASYWEGSSTQVDVVPLAGAARERLLSYAPTDVEKLDLGDYQRRRSRVTSKVKLRSYQAEAVEAWFRHDCLGVLEMATGTGKTKTAAECISRLDRQSGKQLTVITAPYQHIAAQWIQELSDRQPVIAHGGADWRRQLADAVADVKLGRRSGVTVVAVQDTAGGDRFTEALKKSSAAFDRILFVGDEVHGLGAPETRRALLGCYTHRLGLSATPSRWFDEDGTRVLDEYFGGVVYTFGIKEALEWCDPESGLSALCPYKYYPHAISLEGEELEEYLKLSERLRLFMGKDDRDSKERLELLLFKRAAIVKTASQKIDALAAILDRAPELRDGLIYCHSKEQMAHVTDLLHQRGLTYHRFTGDEGTRPLKEFHGRTERDVILSGLADGMYQALVAIKCLDEGVDVPSAAFGVILASSSNPKEYIQRRGRLLRRSPGKTMAMIHDVVVVPDQSLLNDPVLSRLERDLFEKELKRIDEFGADASNGLEVRSWVLNLFDSLT